jgi:hypothetical protein
MCPGTGDSSSFDAFLTISTTLPCARRASSVKACAYRVRGVVGLA